MSVIKARHRRRHLRDRQSGVALLVSISTLALLVALVSEFSYDTTIHTAQATNAKDELRAHYMAKSAISLARLLIKIQKRFVDPIMTQAQQMMRSAQGAASGANAAASAGGGDMAISLRVTDYAGAIMGFFGGSKDEVNALGSLIGLDTSLAKGLGMKNGRMDADISTEDGKIDLNCGGGGTANRQRQLTIYRLLTALTYSPRYNRLFELQNADGQVPDRMELSRALIDWADADIQGFSPEAGGGGSEDYRYDQRRDKYRAHDNSYDTIEETGMVRHMDARFLEAFSPYFTVYASDPRQSCRVNLAAIKGDCTPLLVGLIRAAATADPLKPPTDISIMDDQRVYPLASILCERGTAVGFDSLRTIIAVLNNPSGSIAPTDPRAQMMQSMRGITLDEGQLGQVAYVGSPRVYRIVATGESGKVKKRITAVLDTGRGLDNPVTMNPMSEKAAGVLQYWREE